MAERGLVQRLEEPSAVLLRLSVPQARQQIIQLRGADHQHQVLDYLLARPAGEWIWVSWVYAETGAKLSDLHTLADHGLIELVETRGMARSTGRSELCPFQRPAPDSRPGPCLGGDPAVDRTPSILFRRSTPHFSAARRHGERQDRDLYAGSRGHTGARTASCHPRPRDLADTADDPPIFCTIHRGTRRDSQRPFLMANDIDTWRRIRGGQIRLVIGPRSALFAPFSDIGLIVLDEEHSSSYKQSDVMPTYHAREVATYLAQIYNGVVLFGSATPDISTFYQAHETHAIHLLELPQRLLGHRQHVQDLQAQLGLADVRYKPLGSEHEDVYAADLPPVRVVDMRHELRSGNRSMFSRGAARGDETHPGQSRADDPVSEPPWRIYVRDVPRLWSRGALSAL